MPNQSKHASINIGLIQAREALMTQFRPILNQANITDQQWRIIRLLAENGTLDFQDLANQACILRPSLTGILTRLEKAGLVVRLKPSNDQRRVYLKLTNEGEKLFESIGAQVDERYDAIEQVLSKEKMLELKELLPRLLVAAVLRAAIVHQHIRFGAQRRAMLQLRVVRSVHFHIQLRLMAFIQAAAACAAVQRQPLFQFVIQLRAAVAQGDARAVARIQRRQRKAAVQRHRPPLIQMGKRQLHFRIITLPLHGFRRAWWRCPASCSPTPRFRSASGF